MIGINIMGGLGNQLFQMFTLLSIAIDTGKEIFLTTGIKHGERKIEYWSSVFSELTCLIRFCDCSKFRQIREQNFTFNPISIPDGNCVLFGYFQSYKYFHHNKNKILSILNWYDKVEKLKPYFDYKTDMVSMHFRLGDYKKLQHCHNILNYQYYSKSLSYILEKQPHLSVLYFCEDEDLDYVNEVISQLKSEHIDTTFVRCPSTFQDWEQVIMMSLCKSNIIANSTFSWWGAYLNMNNPTVCYPSQWFGPQLQYNDTKDLFPNNWTKIDI